MAEHNHDQPASGHLSTNVSSSTLAFIWRGSRSRFIIYTLLMIVGSVVLFALVPTPQILILSLVPYGSWITTKNRQAQTALLSNFAILNNLAVQTDKQPLLVGGTRIVRSPLASASLTVQGTIKNQLFELYNWEQMVGQGKGRNSEHFTVFAVNIGARLPNLYAQCQQRGTATFMDRLDLHLPSIHHRPNVDFGNELDQYYRVYSDDREQIPVLQIFDPIIMRNLVDQPVRFDFELLGHTLYIYHFGNIRNHNQLSSMVNFAESLSPYLIKRAPYMHVPDDVASIKQPYGHADDEAHTNYLTALLNAITIFCLATPVFLFPFIFVPTDPEITRGLGLMTLIMLSIGLILWRIRRTD